MDFAFTDEQTMIAETARAFFGANAGGERTRAAMADGGMDRALWASFCRDLGLSAIGVPERFGGAGLGMVELAIVAEAAGAHVAALPLLGHAMVCAVLRAGGTEAMKALWLPRLLGGAVAAAAQVTQVAQSDGGAEGASTLTCVADFVPHGAQADVFLILSGEQAWLVPAGAAVCVTAHTTMDQTRPLAGVALVGAGAMPLRDGRAALAGMEAGWLCLAAEALGGAQAALDRTVAYARERVQFGRPIGSFQAYKHRLADRMVDIEQARSAVYWAACALDEDGGEQADDERAGDERAIAIHAAKSFAADACFRCAADMIQLHGGIGFTWEHDAHLYFKRARSLQTLLGTGAWHRERIARIILGEAA